MDYGAIHLGAGVKDLEPRALRGAGGILNVSMEPNLRHYSPAERTS